MLIIGETFNKIFVWDKVKDQWLWSWGSEISHGPIVRIKSQGKLLSPKLERWADSESQSPEQKPTSINVHGNQCWVRKA